MDAGVSLATKNITSIVLRLIKIAATAPGEGPVKAISTHGIVMTSSHTVLYSPNMSTTP
jgi:hypothetical protein